MFLNISMKSNGRWITIAFLITLFILVASIILMIGMLDRIKNGEKIQDRLDLSFKNYYVQYDMTVISNKNINTYNVKEWHKEDDTTKLEYLDYMKNTVTITVKDSTCTISNNGNVAKLVINNMHENRNIASLSTFGHLYNISCQNCGCEKTQHIKENELVIRISLKAGCSCDCNNIAEELGVSELELILVDNKPKNYTVLDKNKKEYISIVYNVYEKNIEI